MDNEAKFGSFILVYFIVIIICGCLPQGSYSMLLKLEISSSSSTSSSSLKCTLFYRINKD